MDELVAEIRSVPKKKIKWVCPVCSGEELLKQKVIYKAEAGLGVEVTTELGELIVQVSQEEDIVEKTKFPIRYCPWCGRKIREKYKKHK